MATNKFKSVMVNPSYELEFPTASEFVKVNKLAEIGKDVAFHNLVINSDGSPGKIELTDAESSINIGNGLLEFSCDVISGLPRAIINSAGYGIELPSVITNENGVTFQSSPSPENSKYVSIDPVNGISTSGKLTINDTQGYAGWNFENGTIRNWNKYCDSAITTGNNDVDSGNGYSTINLTAKKYSKGSLTDSISIGLDGSTKTVNINANGGVVISHNFAKQSADADAVFNALELTNANDAGLIVSLSGGYNGTPETKLKGKSGRFVIDGAILENCTLPNYSILGNLVIKDNKILGGALSLDTHAVFVDINDTESPDNSEIYLNVYANSIRIANTNPDLGALDGYEIKMTAPKVSISDTFVIPVYTCDESGNYTKVANETKTVRCIKNTVNGKVTYTLELA